MWAHLCYNILMGEEILSKDAIAAALGPVFRVYNVRRAVLFGSYAKATATPSSDVDILVDSGLKGMKFVGFVEKIHETLNKNVDVLDVTHIDDGSMVSREIDETGVLIYER